MKRSRTSHDYTAEIEVTAEFMKTSLRQALVEEDYALSSTGNDSEYTLLAKSTQSSIQKHIVHAQPDRMEWSITVASPHTCRLTADYSLSLRMKYRLYSLFTMIGVLNSVFYILLDHYPTSITAKMIVARLGGLNLVICGFFGTGAVLLFVTFMLAALLPRYRLGGQSLLRKALSKIQTNKRGILNESHLYARKRLISAGLMIYAACLLLWPTMVFHSDWFWPILSKQREILILVIAGILLITVSRATKARPYFTGKASPVNVNTILAICVLILLFMFPLQAYRITRYTISMAESSFVPEHSSENDGMEQNDFSSFTKQEMPNVYSAIRRQGLLLLILYCMFGIIVVVLLFYCGRTLEFYSGKMNSLHQQAMQGAYTSQHKDDEILPSRLLSLPITTRILIIGIFLLYSSLCWVGVAYSLSILNALLLPRFSIISISVGRTIVNGTGMLARVGFGPFETRDSMHLFHFLYLIPVTIPFLLFLWLHLYYVWCSYKQNRRMVPLEGTVSDLVQTVSCEMGVLGIRCLLDPNRKAISPFADFRGFIPQKRIVFSQGSLDFIETFPEHGIAVIAHEVGHLKSDFTSLWLLPFLSRLGLVGAGFLSMLQNSLLMEDRADTNARAYLGTKNMDEGLIGEAAKLLEYLGHGDENQILNAACVAPNKDENQDIHHESKASLWKTAARSLHLTYQLYFGTQIYDYLHRDARYRAKMRRKNE